MCVDLKVKNDIEVMPWTQMNGLGTYKTKYLFDLVNRTKKKMAETRFSSYVERMDVSSIVSSQYQQVTALNESLCQ